MVVWTRISGDTEDGSGKARLCTTGCVYEGQFQGGKRHGQGVITLPTGASYDGQHRRGMFHGAGSSKIANGNAYTGQWRDDQRHGQGTWTFTDDASWEGPWSDTEPSGPGTWRFPGGQQVDGAGPVRGERNQATAPAKWRTAAEAAVKQGAAAAADKVTTADLSPQHEQQQDGPGPLAAGALESALAAPEVPATTTATAAATGGAKARRASSCWQRHCCHRDACSRVPSRERGRCFRGCCYRGCCSPACCGAATACVLLLLVAVVLVGGRVEKSAFEAAADTGALYLSGRVCTAAGQTLASKAAACAAGARVLNCGPCGACSTAADVRVCKLPHLPTGESAIACTYTLPLPPCKTDNRTLRTLTGTATRCALWSFFGAAAVRRCYARDIGFTAGCEACWVDNVMCDQAHCKWTCLQMVLSGQRRNREGDGRIVDCLLCDERMCGPAFFGCAGANRRTAGLVSDIGRKSVQNCNKTGW